MLEDAHPRVLRALRRHADGTELLEAAMAGDQRARQILARLGICLACNDALVRFRWVEIADGRLQIRASCRRCGGHRYWAPQSAEVIAKIGLPRSCIARA